MIPPACNECGVSHDAAECPEADVVDLDEVLAGRLDDPERIVNALLHAGRVAEIEQVAAWTPGARAAAGAWAVAKHGRTLGLNVRVPAIPDHVRALPRLSAFDKLEIGAPVRGRGARVFDGIEASLEEPAA